MENNSAHSFTEGSDISSSPKESNLEKLNRLTGGKISKWAEKAQQRSASSSEIPDTSKYPHLAEWIFKEDWTWNFASNRWTRFSENDNLISRTTEQLAAEWVDKFQRNGKK